MVSAFNVREEHREGNDDGGVMAHIATNLDAFRSNLRLQNV